jgi:hypothetical protein
MGPANSSHRQARGIDIFDPHRKLDDWITDAVREEAGLYHEAAASTPAGAI